MGGMKSNPKYDPLFNKMKGAPLRAKLDPRSTQHGALRPSHRNPVANVMSAATDGSTQKSMRQKNAQFRIIPVQPASSLERKSS